MSKYFKEDQMKALIANVFDKIETINYSDYSICQFLESLEKIRRRDKDDDLDWYIVECFTKDNDIYEDCYETLCTTFLGKGFEPLKKQREEGPYGGAFASWQDFYNWKEG